MSNYLKIDNYYGYLFYVNFKDKNFKKFEMEVD